MFLFLVTLFLMIEQDLQASLSHHQRESSAREDALKAELATMRSRWQAAEAKHEEAALGLADATRPLIKQVDALQNQLKTRSREWYVYDRIESK